MSGLPEITFELKITFPNGPAAAVKDDVITRLQSLGVDSFVEGALDGLDVDFDHDNPERDLFGKTVAMTARSLCTSLTKNFCSISRID